MEQEVFRENVNKTFRVFTAPGGCLEKDTGIVWVEGGAWKTDKYRKATVHTVRLVPGPPNLANVSIYGSPLKILGAC